MEVSNRVFVLYCYYGFTITYQLLDNCSTGCQNVLTSPNGTFTSLNFPNRYDNNMNCSWLITVDNSSVIYISFDALFTDGNNDYVKIYDGPSIYSTSMRYSSGLYAHQPGPTSTFYSSTNQVFVVFITDGWNTNKGFSATYQSVKKKLI